MFKCHNAAADCSGTAHVTRGLKAAFNLGLSKAQSQLELGEELGSKTNSQPLRGTQKKKVRGARGGGGREGAAN